MRDFRVQVITFDTGKVLFERVLSMTADDSFDFRAVTSVLELMFRPIKVSVVVALLPLN